VAKLSFQSANGQKLLYQYSSAAFLLCVVRPVFKIAVAMLPELSDHQNYEIIEHLSKYNVGVVGLRISLLGLRRQG
jgi:hypothetical protein